MRIKKQPGEFLAPPKKILGSYVRSAVLSKLAVVDTNSASSRLVRNTILVGDAAFFGPKGYLDSAHVRQRQIDDQDMWVRIVYGTLKGNGPVVGECDGN